MTYLRNSIVPAAAIALTFGLQFPDPQLLGEPAPLPNDGVMVLAANGEQSGQPQSQTEENAKMGKESGTETGNLPVLESDSKKVDQPPGAHPGKDN